MERELQTGERARRPAIARDLVKEPLMKRFGTGLFFGLPPLAALVMLPSTAHAELDACGGVFVATGATCQFHKEQDCVDTCKVVSVEESCTANLYTTCQAGCTATATATCTDTCSPVCVNDCTAAPSPATSAKICDDDCVADCNTKCADSKNPECCAKACPYTCKKKCEERCHDDDQAVECTPKCATACDGSCTSTSNTSCQVDCQTTQWESCKTTTREECTTSCKDKGGVIVCDGEFLNAVSLKDCSAELSAQVSIDVNVDVDVAVKATGNAVTTTETKSKGLNCSFAPASPDRSDKSALFIAAAFAGTALLRRRRQS